MIREVGGNLLLADVEALVNTVNTVGVMGKGIALQFKRAYPDMFKSYAKAAKSGEIELGRMHVWPTGMLEGPRFIINFPTKGHWRANSKLVDIENGLTDLVAVIRQHDIKSIALPPLGCGHGGLDWFQVKELIHTSLTALDDVDVRIYAPGVTPAAVAMQTRTTQPNMTNGRAALVHMLARYQSEAVEPSPIEVQKLLYFLQVAGEPLRLNYVKGRYGPYADNLRHVLSTVEGHFLTGYGDGSSAVLDAEPIAVLPGSDELACAVLQDSPDTSHRIDQVLRLSEGFESMYGMELLASVHWVATQGEHAADSPQNAHEQVSSWSNRKSQLFTQRHVRVAWDQLALEGWLPSKRVGM